MNSGLNQGVYVCRPEVISLVDAIGLFHFLDINDQESIRDVETLSILLRDILNIKN